MKKTLSLFFILFLAACSSPLSIDDSRQIAVDAIMSHDMYTQNDGYNLTELQAVRLECRDCYRFEYHYGVDQAGIEGYYAVAVIQRDTITSIDFIEIKDDALPAIPDRFDTYCENRCGDGLCQDSVCMDANCTCEEGKDNCPEDC